jgi:hypothetical protein
MSWVELFLVFGVSHAVGDFILQTDWQAAHKWGGLGKDPVSRAALRSHIGGYALAFFPAFIWIAADGSVAKAIAAAFLILIPHWIQDDGRLLDLFILLVKRPQGQLEMGIRIAVDQSFHLVAMFLAALILAG